MKLNTLAKSQDPAEKPTMDCLVYHLCGKQRGRVLIGRRTNKNLSSLQINAFYTLLAKLFNCFSKSSVLSYSSKISFFIVLGTTYVSQLNAQLETPKCWVSLSRLNCSHHYSYSKRGDNCSDLLGNLLTNRSLHIHLFFWFQRKSNILVQKISCLS